MHIMSRLIHDNHFTLDSGEHFTGLPSSIHIHPIHAPVNPCHFLQSTVVLELLDALHQRSSCLSPRGKKISQCKFPRPSLSENLIRVVMHGFLFLLAREIMETSRGPARRNFRTDNGKTDKHEWREIRLPEESDPSGKLTRLLDCSI